MVVSCSVLAASLSLAAAQDAQVPQSAIVVGAGNDLRCRLEKGLRITKSGEPITARLVEPVYAGTKIAIPEGSTIKGHVASIASAPRRTGQLLRGDFTRPRTAQVAFDQVILPDGTAVQIRTDTTIGFGAVKTTRYLPKSQRPGVRRKMKDAAKPLSEPNKLQRLGQAAVTSLPYHPEYLDQGTIFDATLLDAVGTRLPADQAETEPWLSDRYLHIRLLTPLDSGISADGSAIEAVVPRPYYNQDRVLLYPAGTKLAGTVTRAIAAGWMKKNGELLFSFHSAQTPDGTTSEVREPRKVGTVHAGIGYKGRGPRDSRVREGSVQLRSGDEPRCRWKRQRRPIICHPGRVAAFVPKSHLVCLQKRCHKLEQQHGHRTPRKKTP
jgi:type IV secretory pathway VirB10-like protein